MKRVLCFSSSHRLGLTDQLTEQGVAYLGTGALECLFVAGEGEQHEGLRARLRGAGADLRIVDGLDEHRESGRLVREVAELLRAFRPEFVSVQTNWQLALAVLAAARARCRPRLVYTINGYRHNRRVRSVAARLAIGAALLLFASRVIAPSRFLARRFGVLRGKTVVIPLGASELFVREAPAPDFAAPLRLIFAGEFRPGKNQELLVRAFAKYVAGAGDGTAELVLPGAGPLLERCKRSAARLGLAGRVLFPGYLGREELAGWYLRSQCAVVPTNVETFGHCIVEPLALGRVVLSRRVGCAEEVIEHGRNGYLYDTESELVGLLLGLPARRAELERVAARASAGRERFCWQAIARRHAAEVFG